MLVAITENANKQISLGTKQIERRELEELRKKERFLCPICGEEVILKLGTKHIWHFAHKRKLHCLNELEGETEYHLGGKKLLYEWLCNQHYKVLLEPYLKEIKQRPDLLVTTPTDTYVIEFQCANISPQLFLKRTETYVNANFMPLWILGGNQLNRQSHNIYRLTPFHWLFSYDGRSPETQPQIVSFCPITKSFLFLKNITSVSPHRSIASHCFIPISKASFIDLLQFSPFSFNSDLWLITKKHWRIPSLKLNESQCFLRNQLYQNGIPLQLFPSEAGIPTKYHHYIETSTYIWQTWILLFLKPKNRGEKVHLNLIVRAFHSLVKKRVFQLRQLPLINNGHISSAIKQYLRFLCHINLINTKDGYHFYILKQFDFQKTIEEALKLDIKMLELFLDLNENQMNKKD